MEMFDRSPQFAMVWLMLLWKANWGTTTAYHAGKKYELGPGQLVSSLQELSFLTGLPRSSVQRALLAIQKRNMIDTATSNDGRVITICNWAEIQGLASAEESGIGTDPAQDRQHYKQLKQEKNINIGQSDQENPENGGKVIELKKSSFDFESVYKLYPRKVKRSVGIKKLEKSVKTQADFDNLIKAVQNYAAECKRDGTEKKFIMHWPTFVNCWQDYISLDTDKKPYEVF